MIMKQLLGKESGQTNVRTGTTAPLHVPRDTDPQRVKPGEYFIVRVHSAQVAFRGSIFEQVKQLVVTSRVNLHHPVLGSEEVFAIQRARDVHRDRAELLGLSQNLISLVPATMPQVSVSIEFVLDKENGWRPEEIRAVATQARGDAHINTPESTERAGEPGSLALFRTTLAHMLRPATSVERSILFDDGTGHSLDTVELEHVVAAVAETVGQPLELLGMDACLMATIEVAYQVRLSAKYLVASEELVPGFSWPYEQIYGELRANPTQSGDRLARTVVQRYAEYCTAHPPSAGDVTKVAIDLGNVDTLATAISDLAAVLNRDMADNADLLWQAQWACYERESRGKKREPNKFRFHLWDIATLAAHLAQHGAYHESYE